jgi:hypothetical protein
MPAGKYWIGDLCYVMHDRWDEFCDKTIVDANCLSGEFQIDGVLVAHYHTAYGDGEYSDGDGNRYGVDAGLIGCIKVDDISPSELENIGLGHVHEFSTRFHTSSSKDGTITFGHVNIETGDSDDYED